MRLTWLCGEDRTPSLPFSACQSDVGIPGLSPGDETMRFLATQRQQLKLLNAALLALLSLAARIVDVCSAALIGVPMGCLSLLLLASTVASGARQVNVLSGVAKGCPEHQAASGGHKCNMLQCRYAKLAAASPFSLCVHTVACRWRRCPKLRI